MTIKVLAFDEMQIFDRKSINIDPKAMAVMLVAFANVDGEQLPLVFQIKPEGLKWRIIMCEGGIEALWDDLISYYTRLYNFYR